MFIKICGITNIEDALLAARLGANALGFIFAPSKRRVTPAIAKKIVEQLPGTIEKVGVFVNAPNAEILDIARHVGLTCIQLHGDESQEDCDIIGETSKVIKAIKVDPKGNMNSKSNYRVWKLLFDTHLPGIKGGTGTTFDWRILDKFDRQEIIVAGGLNPGNIHQLLTQYTPYGIDVSSGVEQHPGKKDAQKLTLLFEKIDQALKLYPYGEFHVDKM